MPIKLEVPQGAFYYSQFNVVFRCLHDIATDRFKRYFDRSSLFFSTRLNGLDVLIPKVRTESAKKGTFYTRA